VNSHTNVHARSNLVPNQRTPLTLLAIFLSFLATLSLSGCAGLTTASTPAANKNSSTASAGSLAASATSFSFGNVATGSSSLQTLTFTNTGAAAVTISQATVTGAGFSVVEGMSSVSIAAGQNRAFQVQFAPQAAGSTTGSIVVASDASNSPLSVSLSGTGVAALSITTQPTGQMVTAGQTATFTVAATGAAMISYQWKKGGTAISGATSTTYTTPATTASDNGAQFTVTVTNSTGNVTSNAAGLIVNNATFLLNASTKSLSFANVNLGSSSNLGVTFTNAGSSSITISNVSISGAGYTASGVATGQILTPGQSATLNVTFTPAATGSLAGTATVTSNATNSPATISLTGTGVQGAGNAVSFLGTDTTTQGAWKGIGNFNAPPATNSLIYGRDGVILPDTENCDLACNPFPGYVSFGPSFVNASTTGNIGSKPYSTHAYVDLVQGPPSVTGPEPPNPTNTNYFECNYTPSNPAAPWAPMVAWRPISDTREISQWYTCGGITSFYLEFSFGNSTHNFEVYVVNDQNGGTQLRSEQLQVLDGDNNAVLYDSGSFTSFTGGVYYKWSITGHVKVKVINTGTNGTSAVINGAFFN
jgi:hypothetical protein